MKSEWVRVTRTHPCPVCQKPDWCGVSADGNVAHCMRVQSDKPIENGGWLHALKEPLPKFIPREKPPQKSVAADFDAIYLGIKKNTTVEQLTAFSDTIGVSVASLDALGASWSDFHGAWAFPMRNFDGRVTGVRLRNSYGQKWAIPGSKQGLFYDPLLESTSDRVLYVCEGPTDAAAAITLGLPCVGRAQSLGQADEIRHLCKRLGFTRVVIIADNDEAKQRADGSVWYPGQEGARRLMADVKMAAKLIIPPMKDLRAWLCGGATLAALRCIEQQKVWVTHA